jgi:gliding motility-associated-like protein
MRKNHILFFMALLLAGNAGAQLCQGSLGDPIVNITFGSGANPGPSPPAAATSYQYLSADCPNDGQYTIRNATASCFAGTWHTVGSDHTGGGYFMLVNASYQPGAFYVDTVDLSCSNTTYEFAAWVMNVLRSSVCNGNSIEPNLTFRIEKTDGTLLKTYDTGNIPSQSAPDWKQYGFFFATPPNVTRIVLRIINNAPGGCGNDLALDDITFRPCGPLLNASITGGGTLKDFCEGEAQAQTFSSVVSPGYANPYFQWQQSLNGGLWTDISGAHDTTLDKTFSAATVPGEYRYRLAVSQMENLNTAACRVASNVLTVRVNANPQKTIPAEASVCEGGGILLSAAGGAQYRWSGPNGFSFTGPDLDLQNVQAFQSGNYFLEVINAAGCRRRDSLPLTVNPRPVASADPDTVFICEGSSTGLWAAGGGSYLWKPSTGLSSASSSTPLASPSDSTRYMLIVSNAFSCTDTAYVQVNVSRKPLADAGVDKYILQGQTANLTGLARGTNVGYSWRPSVFMDDAATLQPAVHPETDQTYSLEVVSHDGCGTDVDSVKVHVFRGIYVPNAFSPNQDGLNDYWTIPALKAYADYEVKVFNRWGQLMYKSKNNTAWDGSFNGKALPTGVYPYVIDLKNVPAKLTGWVMLVR